MSSLLQQKLQDFLEAHKLPVATFEREAGLKTSVLRNILRGSSKRPTGDTLQAIANYMGCTVSELMGEGVKSLRASVPRDSPIVEKPKLLISALEVVLGCADDAGHPLTRQQAFSLAEDTYEYALQKKSTQVDLDFVKWRLGRLEP